MDEVGHLPLVGSTCVMMLCEVPGLFSAIYGSMYVIYSRLRIDNMRLICFINRTKSLGLRSESYEGFPVNISSSI